MMDQTESFFMRFTGLYGVAAAAVLRQAYTEFCSDCPDWTDCIEYPRCEAMLLAVPTKINAELVGWKMAVRLKHENSDSLPNTDTQRKSHLPKGND